MPAANDINPDGYQRFKQLLKYFYAQVSYNYEAGSVGGISALPNKTAHDRRETASRLHIFHIGTLLNKPMHIWGLTFTVNFGKTFMGLPKQVRTSSSNEMFTAIAPSSVANQCTYIEVKKARSDNTATLALFADLPSQKVSPRPIDKQFINYFTWDKAGSMLQSLRLGVIEENGVRFLRDGIYHFVDLGLSDRDETTHSLRKLAAVINSYEKLPRPDKIPAVGQTTPTRDEPVVIKPSQVHVRKEPSRIEIKQPRNWILFGAPGTGKSHTIDRIINGLPSDVNNRRITFYPDYTYSQFVGTYKPVPIRRAIPADTDDERAVTEEDITYRFVPGPFIKTLVDALLHPWQPQILIIEEINRADPASVFGNVFQLLDRKANGSSEYPVDVSADLQDYLQTTLRNNPEATRSLASLVASHDADSFECDRIAIPSNMYIWATMNSADQGVFPMDTAFKRRWTFKYLPLNGLDSEPDKELPPLEKEWEIIRNGINDMLKKNGRDIPEDKLLGRYFLNNADLRDRASFTDAFGSKVVMYLFEDAARYCRNAIFKETNGTGQLYLGDLLSNLDLVPDSGDLGIFREDVRATTEDS